MQTAARSAARAPRSEFPLRTLAIDRAHRDTDPQHVFHRPGCRKRNPFRSAMAAMSRRLPALAAAFPAVSKLFSASSYRPSVSRISPISLPVKPSRNSARPIHRFSARTLGWSTPCRIHSGRTSSIPEERSKEGFVILSLVFENVQLSFGTPEHGSLRSSRHSSQ